MEKSGSEFSTRALHKGREPAEHSGMVNTPVYRGSTILHSTLDSLEQSKLDHDKLNAIIYGRFGTPTTLALESAIADLENGYACLSTSSGLGAITTALLAFVKSGDHILVTDTVYYPARRFCDTMLSQFGVETTFYDPMIGGDIEALCRPNTRCIFLESPGSMTFEVQDIPTITQVAKSRGIVTLMDNTWATPYFFRPLDYGVNVSINAATKYIIGHSDAMLGLITSDEEHYAAVRASRSLVGQNIGPDDIYLGLRGLRTLCVRLNQHEQNALALANHLSHHPEVIQVLHPALPSCPGHEFWKRDFSGSSGLFSVILKPRGREALKAMMDNMSLFGLGYSWGGYESLIISAYPDTSRTATQWSYEGQMLRIHAGLEDIDELVDDLDAGLERYREHT